MCTRMKKIFLDEHKGGFSSEYAMLYKYAIEFRRSNRGSTVEVLPIRVPSDEKSKF